MSQGAQVADNEWVDDPVDDDGWVDDPPTEKYTPLQSTARGVAQGGTLGFADEISGGVEALWEKAKGNPAEFGELYKKYRNESRANFAQAREQNPYAFGTGEVTSGVATALIPGLNIAKGAKLAEIAARSALAGGVAGTGYSEAETPEGVAADTATGAVFGGAFGAGAAKAVPWIAGKASQVKEGIKNTFRATQQQAASAAAEGAATAGAKVGGGAIKVEQGGKLFSVKAPESLDELSKWKPELGQSEVLGKTRLRQIENQLPDLKTRPLKYHYDMMENPKAMKALKLEFENLPSDSAQKIAAYNQQIVNESADKIKSVVKNIAGSEPMPLSQAGDDFVMTVKNKYNAERKALNPVFETLQKNAKRTNPVQNKDMAIAIGQNTKLGPLMEFDEQGRVFLKKNSPKSGMSDAEHGALSRVIADMNEGLTFKEIQDTREFLRKQIDLANPAATEEISKVRSILLGQLESLADTEGPSVGQTFKAYAKNERARESVERIIGGKIETFDKMFAANPDRVVKKIFSNPNYAQVVKEYVGEKKLKQLVSSYVSDGISKAYDPAKGFEPSKLRTWLKSNEQFLKSYLDPKSANRLNALADYGYYGKRFLDEVNPSGTAASLLQALKPESFAQKVSSQGVYGAVRSETVGRVATKLRQRQAVKSVNEMLGSPSEKSRRYLPDIELKSRLESGFANPIGGASAGTFKGPQGLSLPAAENQNQENNRKPSGTPASKGPSKWMEDGIAKLSDLIDSTTIEKLKSSKEGQSLLIAASDLKPGSKAFENMLSKIKSKFGEGK
jgi:hypothetical protein